VSYHRLTPTGEWKLNTQTYKGIQTIEIDGKKAKAHYVVGESEELWFDMKGVPLKMSTMVENLHMVATRISYKKGG
jgi:hypothetical protein